MSLPYVVALELNVNSEPGSFEIKYKEISQIIESLSISCKKIEQSVWIIKSDYKPAEILDRIRKVIASEDLVFVCELKNNKQGWLNTEAWKFMNDNIFN